MNAKEAVEYGIVDRVLGKSALEEDEEAEDNSASEESKEK